MDGSAKRETQRNSQMKSASAAEGNHGNKRK